MNISKQERLAECFRRLLEAGDVESASDALLLIAETLTAVEDEMTDIPNQPEKWQTDGRMYPPREDNSREIESRPDLIRYRSLKHNTIIRDNGAIEIRDLQGSVLLCKTGKGGQGVEYEQE